MNSFLPTAAAGVLLGITVTYLVNPKASGGAVPFIFLISFAAVALIGVLMRRKSGKNV